jgi:hypothetical protein
MAKVHHAANAVIVKVLISHLLCVSGNKTGLLRGSLLVEGRSSSTFEPLRAHDSEAIVPQVRLLDHGGHLKTVCILDEAVTS